jgi:hypothetical protein
MKGVPLFSDSRQAMESKSITAAMFASSSPEELLQIFLTNLGEQLIVSRVAIYQLTDQHEGIVLLEAVAPNIQSIKNKIYPLTYFGIDSLSEYLHDQAIAFADVSQITQTLTVHQRWQNSQLRAMISAPIVFDAIPETKNHRIWGLAFVQQCHEPRQWQSQEVNFLLNLSKVLSQCLQAWNLHLRSPKFLEQKLSELSEQDEFTAKRVEFSSTESNKVIDEDLVISSNFILSGDNQNKNLDRSLIKDGESSINNAINLAMQKLEEKKPYPHSIYPRVFSEIDIPEAGYNIDLDSITIENILEDSDQGQSQKDLNQFLIDDQTQLKVNYLQQKVEDMFEDIQGKLAEITALQQQIQKLSISQQEIRQILLDLQSENLPQHLQNALVNMYEALN